MEKEKALLVEKENSGKEMILVLSNENTRLRKQQQFTWDPQHEALIRREWQEKVRVILKDMVNKAANAPAHVSITWMTDDVRAALKYKRETDEEFSERSTRNKRNKTKGPKAKIGLGTYHFG